MSFLESLFFNKIILPLYSRRDIIIHPSCNPRSDEAVMFGRSTLGVLALKAISRRQEVELIQFHRSLSLKNFFAKRDEIDSDLTSRFERSKPDAIQLNIQLDGKSNASITTDDTISFETSGKVYEQVISDLGERLSGIAYEVKTCDPARDNEHRVLFGIATARFHNLHQLLNKMRKIKKIKINHTDFKQLQNLVELINNQNLQMMGIPIKARLTGAMANDTFVRDH